VLETRYLKRVLDVSLMRCGPGFRTSRRRFAIPSCGWPNGVGAQLSLRASRACYVVLAGTKRKGIMGTSRSKDPAHITHYGGAVELAARPTDRRL
jgi:hypothetical protein